MQEVAFMKAKVSLLLNESNVADIPETKIVYPSYLPCSTKEEFLELDETLKTDDSTRKALVHLFKRESCKEYTKFIKRNLKNIVKDEAAQHFTWTASNSNMSMRNFMIIELLVDTACVCMINCNRDDCKAVIKQYFRDAKMRVKKKNSKTSDVEFEVKTEEDCVDYIFEVIDDPHGVLQ